MDRQAGGVLLAFAGVVLLIAGFKGTIGNVWKALVTDTPKPTSTTAPNDALTPSPTKSPVPSINGLIAAVTTGMDSTPQLLAAGELPAGFPGSGNLAFNPIPGVFY